MLLETRLAGMGTPKKGKVRDIYDLGDALLIVATDRVSAFDVVLSTGIPDKGKVLNQLSLFWFGMMGDLVKNHVLESDADKYPAPLLKYADDLRGRSMIVKKAKPFTVECVVRGYLAGSGWSEYREKGSVCGHRAAFRSSGVGPPSRADLYADDEGRRRARRGGLLRAVRNHSRPERGRGAKGPDHCDLQKGRLFCRVERHHYCRYEIRVRHNRQ